MSAAAPHMRLDRLLANMGYGSRKDIATLAKAGHIVLDGATVKVADMHVPVSPELAARMTISGAPLDPPPGFALMLHKPLGVTCSHKEAGPLVYGLLPLRWRARKPAISTIGRLDKETSGLLLATDDGTLLHRIISPKSNVSKRYVVRLARPLRGDEAEVLASGTLMLESEDKPLLPVAMEVVSSGEGQPQGDVRGAPPLALPARDLSLDASSAGVVVRVTLHEGRYHQVRRMFAALGNHVTALHRDRIGGLELPADLAPGEWRVLGPDEVARVLG